MINLSQLLAEQESRLKNNQIVMTDTILEIPLQIEAILRGFVGPIHIPEMIGEKYKHAGGLAYTSAYEAAIMASHTAKSLSISEMLDMIVSRQEEVRAILGEASYEAICKELQILYTVHTDGRERPFVPTESQYGSPITGSGSGWEEEKRAPKFLECIALLRNIETPEGGHIDTRDIIVDLQAETPDSMMRTLPYVVIRIPRLSRTIIIDDRIGEATFVLRGLIDLDIIRSSRKKELETGYHARRIIYDMAWGDHLTHALMYDWDDAGSEKTAKNIPTPRIVLDMASLFLDREIIRSNLEKYAQTGGVPLAELSSVTPKQSTEVVLSNGVKMKWNTFLNNASQYLLGTSKGNTENPHRQGDALDRLCEMVGVVRIDADYFTVVNKEHLISDLEKYAQAGGVRLVELSSSTPKPSAEVVLSNRVKMKWMRFLNNASQYILGTKNGSTENPHRSAEALDRLCEMVGVVRIQRTRK